MHFPGFLLSNGTSGLLFRQDYSFSPALSRGHFIELTDIGTAKRLPFLFSYGFMSDHLFIDFWHDFLSYSIREQNLCFEYLLWQSNFSQKYVSIDTLSGGFLNLSGMAYLICFSSPFEE